MMVENDVKSAGWQVAAEVEVVYFNLRPRRGLLAGCLSKAVDGRRSLLRGSIVPGEQPGFAARRLLESVAQVRVASHAPVLVSARVAAHRQVERPTLTLSYAVLGRLPDHSAPEWTYGEYVDELEPPLDERVDDAGSVRAARSVVSRLIEDWPIALDLLERPEEPFKLSELHWVYSTVMGPDVTIDVSNFRRKVERAHGFVKPANPPAGKSADRAPRGRPATWYIRGSAERIQPPIRFRS